MLLITMKSDENQKLSFEIIGLTCLFVRLINPEMFRTSLRINNLICMLELVNNNTDSNDNIGKR